MQTNYISCFPTILEACNSAEPQSVCDNYSAVIVSSTAFESLEVYDLRQEEKLVELNYVTDSTPKDLRLSRDPCRLDANDSQVLLKLCSPSSWDHYTMMVMMGCVWAIKFSLSDSWTPGVDILYVSRHLIHATPRYCLN